MIVSINSQRPQQRSASNFCIEDIEYFSRFPFKFIVKKTIDTNIRSVRMKTKFSCPFGNKELIIVKRIESSQNCFQFSESNLITSGFFDCENKCIFSTYIPCSSFDMSLFYQKMKRFGSFRYSTMSQYIEFNIQNITQNVFCMIILDDNTYGLNDVNNELRSSFVINKFIETGNFPFAVYLCKFTQIEDTKISVFKNSLVFKNYNMYMSSADTTFEQYFNDMGHIITSDTFVSLMLQLLFALGILQKTIKLKHHDLHKKNVLIKKLNTSFNYNSQTFRKNWLAFLN